MRTWIRVAGGLFALTAVTVIALLLLAFQREPAIEARADITPADIERALNIVRRYDPRRMPGPFMRRIDMTERDLDLLLHHAMQRRLPVSTRLKLGAQQARVQASLALPAGWWLNLDVALRQTSGLPEIDSVKVGHLPVPPRWAEAALRWAAAHQGVDTEAALSADVVRRVLMQPGRARIVYVWLPDTAQRLLSTVLPAADQQRLAAYQAHLVGARSVQAWMQPVSVAEVLPPLFRMVAERSAASGDALSENRSAILALALFANRRNVGSLLTPMALGAPALPVRLLLNGREDSALHFLVSAALAVDAGTPLADAVGLYKEMVDARGGSGFSFNDLAADRAGTRFGELAKAAPERFQAALIQLADERAFMPEAEDLPEFMTEAEFVARFGGVGAPAYRQMLEEIEQRVARCALYRRPGA